jgi:hypothetical protein
MWQAHSDGPTSLLRRFLPRQSGHQTFSAEVTAETLYEAAVLGLKALDVDQRFTHNITIDVRVKNPETTHSISGESLKRGLHGPAKSATDQALKSRLKGWCEREDEMPRKTLAVAQEQRV